MPAATLQREKRQQAILEILRSQPVSRQTELVARLKALGIDATQSSVSRDLRQLGITKLGEAYQPVAANDADSGVRDEQLELVSGFVRRIDAAGPNLTVLGTAIGAAQRVALYLDRSDWPEIVGTLSGDDTIFVATRNASDQKRLIARLRAIFNA